MQEFTLSWAAAGMRATAFGFDAGSMSITGVCTDSRKAAPGSLFFALKGEHADGHKYVQQALSKGAAAVVAEASRIETVVGQRILVVQDPLNALGDLARAYRSQFSVKVIGITGSVGKTSTKEMTAHILRTKYKVHASERNYNTEIGVPLTLFGLNPTDDVAVVEMGMRASGEIRTLARMAQPSIAIVTNIGYAHLELLGSRKAIAEAKAEMLEALPPGGVAVLPDDLPYPEVVKRALPSGSRVIRVGNEGSDVWAEPCVADSGEAAFRVHVKGTGESAGITLKVAGVHHSANALLAIAAARELAIPLAESAAAIETWVGAEGRMTIRAGMDNITVLDDCYNAGPESMAAALATLKTFRGSHVAILGDMRELGEPEVELHRMLGRNAADADLRLLVTVGHLAELIAESALAEVQSSGKSYSFEVARFASTIECEDRLADLLRSGDTVLVKGSRAMAMERLVARLVGEPMTGHHG